MTVSACGSVLLCEAMYLELPTLLLCHSSSFNLVNGFSEQPVNYETGIVRSTVEDKQLEDQIKQE